MKKGKFIKKVIAIGVVIALAVSPIQHNPNSSKVVNAAEKDKWTIALYLCGSDLESGSLASSEDLIEIMEAKDMPDDVNIVVQTGGSKKWHYKSMIESYYEDDLNIPKDEVEKMDVQNISSDYIQRYIVKYDNVYDVPDSDQDITYPSLELLDEKVGVNNPNVLMNNGEEEKYMGDEDVLTDFLEYTQLNFAAQKNALILWNHGGGTVGGVCCDSYNGDSLSLLELSSSLETVKTNVSDEKYDLIGFDACLMGSFETMAAISPYAEYSVAALTSEPTAGWYYTPFLDELSKDCNEANKFSGKELGTEIVNSFEDYYKDGGVADQDEMLSCFCDDARLSLFDLGLMPQAMTSFNDMAEKLLFLLTDQEGHEKFEKYIYDNAKQLDEGFDLIGMKSFLETSQDISSKLVNEYTQENTYVSTNLAEKYKAYSESAEKLSDVLFGDNGLEISSYNGWEDNEYWEEGGLSFYYPTPSSMAGFNFVDKSYPLSNISKAYSAYAYAVAYEVNLEQQKDVNEKLQWYKESNMFELSIDKGMSKYISSMGASMFTRGANNNYYLVRESEAYGEDKYEFEPDTQYMTFQDEPVTLDETLSIFGLYSIRCIVNSKIATLYFHFDEKNRAIFDECDFDKDVYGDEIESLEPGDTIIPVRCESENCEHITMEAKDHESNVVWKAIDTIKSSDLITASDGSKSCVLPLKWTEGDENKLYYDFYVYLNSVNMSTGLPIINNHVVRLDEIEQFSNASIKINQDKYEMSGSEITPKVEVTSGDLTYTKDVDYTVTYRDNLKKGTAKIIVKGIGRFEAVPAMTKSFTITAPTAEAGQTVTEQIIVEKPITSIVEKPVQKIVEKLVVKMVPVKGKIKSAKKKKNTIKVVFAKQKDTTIQYQISFSNSKKGKKKIAGSTNKGSYLIKKVKAKKTYFIAVRGCITINGKKYYGEWSGAKKVKA